jgi:hypothetical protein
MFKQFLITTHLLLSTAAPVQAQSITTAQMMGEIVGEYYCYAIGIGVRNSDEMVQALLTEKDPKVSQTMTTAYKWYEQGRTDLYYAYIHSLSRHTTLYCREEFQRYLENN